MRWVIATENAIIEPQVCVLSEACWASLFDVTNSVVREPFCACGKAARMVESVAWEENLGDTPLLGEEFLVRVDPGIEPHSRVFAGRTDTVLLGDQENMPDRESRCVVA